MSYWGHRQENSHLIKGVLKLKKKKGSDRRDVIFRKMKKFSFI